MAYDRQFAEQELDRAGFGDKEFKSAVLHFLDAADDLTRGDSSAVKQLSFVVHSLVDRRVLTEITEEDFEDEYHSQGDNSVLIRRCTRYPYLYQTEDGKYWDDRAVGFKTSEDSPDIQYRYQSQDSSKREVSLPYFPETEIKILGSE